MSVTYTTGGEAVSRGGRMPNLSWRLGNPLALQIVAPIDRSDPAAPVVVASGSYACHVFVYDSRAETELSADAVGSLLPVESVDGFSVGDAVGVRFPGSIGATSLGTPPEVGNTLSSINAAGLQLTLSAAPFGALPRGTRVARRLDDGTITGALYGTASLTERESWGWVAVLPSPPVAVPAINHLVRGSRCFAEMLIYATASPHAVVAAERWDLLVTDPYGRP